jgi:tol-pal system protein YbgF
MRIGTQSVAWLVLSCACASAAPASKGEREPDAETRALVAAQAGQARRIEELEARIALLEADARHVREVSNAAPPRSGETIRIAPPTAASESPAAPALTEIVSRSEPEPRGDTRRIPSYRLYGQKTNSAREPLAAVPEVSETLPVAPLPEQRAKRLPLTAAAHEGTDPTADYRAALRMLHDRHFDEASSAFGAFLADNPAHPLASNAIYWRGEARYAKRDYAEALADFESLLERFPNGEKAPDALLKVALCFRKLGAEDKAQLYFRRLRTTYPNSQAASIASREGST